MSEEIIHYGVAGMKWGKRKSLAERKNAAANTSVAKSLTRLDGVRGTDLIKAKGNLKNAVADRNAKNVSKIERSEKRADERANKPKRTEAEVAQAISRGKRIAAAAATTAVTIIGAAAIASTASQNGPSQGITSVPRGGGNSRYATSLYKY